ncbi:MAG: ABC transporter ATP-binding protein, partial [Ruminococcus sp.]|nr:ABC transporter ATP-binding protein [Ruminococcus sp.]
LELKNITKKYSKKTALSDVSLNLKNGVYALLGPNGAGKTTLINIITGLLMPTSGTVLFNGTAIGKNMQEYISKIGYLPQYPQFYKNFRADEFLRYMAVMKGIEKKRIDSLVNELIEKVNLTNDSHRYIGQYSGGMRQRLGIAQALLNNPEILILDEPTAGLDPKERIRFRNLISQLSENRIVILATHIVSDVESIAKEVILLKNGEVLQIETPMNLISQMEGKVHLVQCIPEKLEEYMNSFCISNASVCNDRYLLRIVSDNPPTENAEITIPNLEDAYLYYFGELK